MSSAAEAFKKGVTSFRGGRNDEALQHFSEAIERGKNDAVAYDSRAAVFEKLGRYKEALTDSKRVIELDTNRWQGYARSARLFLTIGKLNAAQTMVDLALQKVKQDDTQRREEIQSLSQKIRETAVASAKRKQEQASKEANHFANLPVELATTIFQLALEGNASRVVVFAQVCRNWRNVLLAAPSFWRELHLTSHRPERKAKLWLARSQGRLEALYLLGKSDAMTLSMQQLRHASFSRLRRLIISGMAIADLRSHLQPLTLDVVSQLHELRLVDVDPSLDSFWLFKPESMELRHLAAHGSLIDWPAASQHCTHLQELTFRGPLDSKNWDDLLWLLHANNNLETVDIHVSTGSLPARLAPISDFHRDLPTSIDMSHLTSLSLGGMALAPITIIRHVSLPALQTLHLEKCVITGCLSLILGGPGMESLRDFKMIRCSGAATEVIQFLRKAANLRSLALQYFDEINRVIEALVSPPAGPSATSQTSSGPTATCPLLTHVNLSHSADLRTGPVLRLVKSHLAKKEQTTPEATAEVDSKISAIETLVLDGCPWIDADMLPWLRVVVPSVSCIYLTKKEAKSKR